jgi:hypothetical protein
MKRRLALLIVIALVLGGSVNTHANVSSAAVLFLRIAAGARAAGMGEAFVAVADDATSTHWNPAGLGTYPLSGKWFDIKIPEQYNSIKRVALFKNEGSDIDYKRFDIWAITELGLVKYSKGDWRQGEIIETDPQQSSESILRQYTGLAGEAAEQRIPELMEKIGKINNYFSRDRIDSLRNKMQSALPESYSSREEFENSFNILNDSYNQCLIDWNMITQADELFYDGFKDSTLDQSEADKILVALEKAKRRFLPEEIIIPFNVSFSGNLNDLTADNDFIWLATDSGLYRYNNRNWQRLLPDDKTPVSRILLVKLFDDRAYIGTDSGLLVYDAGAIKHWGESDGLQSGEIKGIAIKEKDNIWVLVNDDLYHFDGTSWKNYYEFNNILEHTDSSIYEDMKIYNTASEREKFLKKFNELNPAANMFREQTQELLNNIDTMGIYTAYFDAQVRSRGVPLQDSAVAPKEKVVYSPLTKVPYTAGFGFELTDLDLDSKGALWVGTEYGLLKYDGRKWMRYGYKVIIPENDITIFDYALEKVDGDSARAGRLARNIMEVNGLDSDWLMAGQSALVLANPAGAKVNKIQPIENKTFFATEAGIIIYGDNWSRVNEQNLGKRNSISIQERDGDKWFVTKGRIFISAAAKSEISMMHVNWLPEFANDMYYDFFSYVRAVEGWGTVGGNITFLSYGNITRTDEAANVLGEFLPFDIAVTLSYGTPLSQSLSGGISARVIYSHLSSLGTGREQGSGTSTGLAFDIGMLYRIHRRVNLGMAVTNIGPDISYIDVSQADPLPRNLAVGVAWKMIESAYNKALITVEANKSLVGIDDVKQEMKEVILNGGAEYWYGSFIAFRGGYIYDQEGEVMTPTMGFGLAYKSFQFDFAYIPSSENVPLANTMRFSLSIDM